MPLRKKKYWGIKLTDALRVEAVAELFGVTRQWVHSWQREGKLKSRDVLEVMEFYHQRMLKIGKGGFYYTWDDLAKWLGVTRERLEEWRVAGKLGKGDLETVLELYLKLEKKRSYNPKKEPTEDFIMSGFMKLAKSNDDSVKLTALNNLSRILSLKKTNRPGTINVIVTDVLIEAKKLEEPKKEVPEESKKEEIPVEEKQ